MNKRMKLVGFSAAFCILVRMGPAAAMAQVDVLHETFDTLDAWTPLTFRKIEAHSRYDIIPDGTNKVLQASSSDAASGIMLNATFDIYKTPILQWRWKVDHVLEKGDALTKEGDDYPLRIYVMFIYDPATAGFGITQRAQYALARKLYGKYPPHSALNYIWANKEQRNDIIPNAYTDRAMMIILQSGPARTGQWITETVNILEDYQRAFGTAPPAQASIAIMTDTDNTGEKSLAYLDDLILRAGP
ncbi:MAG: DUF3047 domain-containing protein [Verrucomicrobia bacterium]|nr:DUF3047 domain-containing protein [Verrucomicrobiota bacterium]